MFTRSTRLLFNIDQMKMIVEGIDVAIKTSMKTMGLKFIVFFLLLLVTTSGLHAKAREERITLKDPSGESVVLGLSSYKNEMGVLEVRIDAAGLPKFMDRLNPTIAFGRDLNDDQKIETWFFLTGNGIETEKAEGLDPLGKDILPRLIFKRHLTTARLYITSATTTLLSYILLSAKEATDKEKSYVHDWINLEEIKIRLEREINSPANGLTREQIQFQYTLVSSGYKFLADDMEKFAKGDFWKWAGVDVGLWFTGSFLFKSAASVLLKAGSYITETSVYLAFKEELHLFVAKNISLLREKGAALSAKLGIKNENGLEKAAPLAIKMSAYRLRTTMIAVITADIAKNRIRKVIGKAVKWPVKIAEGIRSEWRYISMSTGIQLSAETAAHYSEVYDPNPLVMARNVLTNEDILQNIGFMTTDTILMTGVSKSLHSTKARFMVSGLIGMHNSAMINLVIKNEDNYSRVALDTAWESVIGNAQVQIDLKVLETFEKMAAKKNSPRLKLLGYAVVLVNQGTGYYLYSKAADKVKTTNEDIDVKLIPVLAES